MRVSRADVELQPHALPRLLVAALLGGKVLCLFFLVAALITSPHVMVAGTPAAYWWSRHGKEEQDESLPCRRLPRFELQRH